MTVEEVFGALPFVPVPFEMPQPSPKRAKAPKPKRYKPPFKLWRAKHRAKKAGLL